MIQLYKEQQRESDFFPSLSNSLRIQITKATKKPSTLTKQFVRISDKIQKFSALYMLAKLNDFSLQVAVNSGLKVLTVVGDHGVWRRCSGVSPSLCLLALCFWWLQIPHWFQGCKANLKTLHYLYHNIPEMNKIRL